MIKVAVVSFVVDVPGNRKSNVQGQNGGTRQCTDQVSMHFKHCVWVHSHALLQPAVAANNDLGVGLSQGRVERRKGTVMDRPDAGDQRMAK